jgi:hypothetical protein
MEFTLLAEAALRGAGGGSRRKNAAGAYAKMHLAPMQNADPKNAGLVYTWPKPGVKT